MPIYLRVLRLLNYTGLIWFGILGVAFGISYFLLRFIILDDNKMPDLISLSLGYILYSALVTVMLWGPALLILSVTSFIAEKRYFRKNNLQDKKFWQHPSFWLGILSGAVFILYVWAIASGEKLIP